MWLMIVGLVVLITVLYFALRRRTAPPSAEYLRWKKARPWRKGR